MHESSIVNANLRNMSPATNGVRLDATPEQDTQPRRGRREADEPREDHRRRGLLAFVFFDATERLGARSQASQTPWFVQPSVPMLAGVPTPRRCHHWRRCHRRRRCHRELHGFARVRCQTCSDELLVAFSCKRRGICPSCTARRMADTAAHLVNHILPSAPYRQWGAVVPS